MAGDWIKVENVTPDKPEIFRISEVLDVDPDAVLGKLIRLWVWADQQTYTGDAASVTRALVDRIAGARGFADAMISSGWLVSTSGGLVFPNFDRHNGETAKQRALTAKRNQRYRAKKRDAAGVTEASPEKRREENKEPPVVPQGTTAQKKPRSQKKPPADEYSRAFEEFWAAYPPLRKAGKRGAWQAWKRAVTRAMPAVILAAVREFAASPKGQGRFCPGPIPWLNQNRWQDDRASWQDSGEDQTGPHEPVDAPMKEY